MGFTRRTPTLSLVLGLLGLLGASACLEPNPNAADAGAGDTSTTTATNSGGTDSGTGGDTGCADCDFLMESVEFDLSDSGTISIPKPDMPHTAPIAAVSRYAPGNNVEDMGYTLSFTDTGSAYELDITLNGDGGNSRVAGVAVVIGLSDALGAPEIEDLDVPSDGCAASSLAAADGTILIDAVSSYEPGGGNVLSYSRTLTSGAPEYCVTAASSASASFGVRAIAFPTPTTATIFSIPDLTLDAAGPVSADYGEVAASSQIAYLVGARAIDEGAAPGLGFEADCSPSSPYGCTYGLLDFNAGASATMGGALLAID